MKKTLEIIKIYNKTLEYFIFNDHYITKRTFENIISILKNDKHALKSLNLTNCCIVSTYLHPLVNCMPLSMKLMHLNLSYNKIGNYGAKLISQAMYNEIEDKFAKFNTNFDVSTEVQVNIVKNQSLQRLELNTCGITYKGFKYLFTSIKSHNCMKYIDLSGNFIESGDNEDDDQEELAQGNEALLYDIYNEESKDKIEANMQSIKKPVVIDIIEFFSSTLQYCQLSVMKLNNCHISTKFASALFQMLSYTNDTIMDASNSLHILDDNDVTSDSKPLKQMKPYNLLISGISSPKIKLSSSTLGSKELSNINLNEDKLIKPSSDKKLLMYNTLEGLYLSSNHISDSCAKSLVKCLSNNFVLKVLDIGFNKFTKESVSKFNEVTKITSTTNDRMKILDLHVNLLGKHAMCLLVLSVYSMPTYYCIGNDCDPYDLELPNRARSKNMFRFGINGSTEDLYNKGFSHIAEVSRSNHLARRANYVSYIDNNQPIPINHIS